MNGLWFIALELGAVGLVLVLLNARDRRRDRAVAAVLEACPRRLRGAIALHARARWLSRRVVVALDMPCCDDVEARAVVRPLAAMLQPGITLVLGVRGDVMPRLTVRILWGLHATR